MEKQDKKTPPIPLLRGDAPKAPFKFALLNKGASFLERFKTFKKKDMAFIMAGLGVLFMAPLAEHFLMSPDAQDSGAFKEGWGFRDGAGSFGKGDSPYERGVNGLAPGALAGGGSDIITPLNVRDPSALVMGPSASAQPPATGAPPEKEGKSDWKDALKSAASESTKRASLPVPKVALSQSGLRGLGAAPGGSGASFKLDPISAANVPNRGGAGPSSLANVRPTQGYKGAAGARGLTNPSGGSIEALKKAARDAGADFNRNGPASAALESAAARQMPAGGADGGMGPGGGGADKGAGQSQDKGSKSTGESLEFLRMKQEQEKAIDLKWKLIEKKTMRWPNLQDKMLESMVMKAFVDPLTGVIADFVKEFGSGGDKKYFCFKDGEDKDKKGDDLPSVMVVKESEVKECHLEYGDKKEKKDSRVFYAVGKNRKTIYTHKDCEAKHKMRCNGEADDKGMDRSDDPAIPQLPPGVVNPNPIGDGRVRNICNDLITLKARFSDSRVTADGLAEIRQAIEAMLKGGQSISMAQRAFFGKELASQCREGGSINNGESVPARLKKTREELVLELKTMFGAMTTAKNGTSAVLGEGRPWPAAGELGLAVQIIRKYFDPAQAEATKDQALQAVQALIELHNGAWPPFNDSKALENEVVAVKQKNNAVKGSLADTLKILDQVPGHFNAAENRLAPVKGYLDAIKAKDPKDKTQVRQKLDDYLESLKAGNLDVARERYEEYVTDLTQQGNAAPKVDTHQPFVLTAYQITKASIGGQTLGSVSLEKLARQTEEHFGKQELRPKPKEPLNDTEKMARNAFLNMVGADEKMPGRALTTHREAAVKQDETLPKVQDIQDTLNGTTTAVPQRAAL
ncbi:MAG: hypothetical protein A3J74_10930 [Elusimicrobia bacterium RIFCSPHIGHO2_02_FULL_57_9]|nr:MAG: hypothetical protein A3J74_10930 [Elusimicrobia bacterium RIFCSPHIGHO2_02_FULL_57_9]